jgi:hypothetical protein
MELNLRPTVIGGDKLHTRLRGHFRKPVNRADPAGRGALRPQPRLDRVINPPVPIPPGATGLGGTAHQDAAKR